MLVQNNSQNTFKGGFRLKSVKPNVKDELYALTKKGRQIFDNFEKQGDIFLVVRDKLDYKYFKYIRDNKIDYEYFPEISTKCALDDEQPEVLSKLLKKIKAEPITTMSGIKKSINKKIRTLKVEEKSETYVKNILNSLCIGENGLKTKTVKGVKVLEDSEFARKVFITPPSKNNIHYVLVQPNSKNVAAKRYAIDSDGNILATYSTPDGICKFREKFDSLLIK